jgi:signal peptidase II
MRLVLFLTLPLYLLDQLTKWLVLAFISTNEVVEVVPGFFNLVQVHNTGAAFGMFKGNNWFFVGLAAVALVALFVMARRNCFADGFTRVAAALLASGVVGNLTDRLVHGYVVDFLDVILPWYGHWPAFNVADSCICVAAGIFLVSGFLPEKKGQAAGQPK